mgnify:CR=1 FL=1
MQKFLKYFLLIVFQCVNIVSAQELNFPDDLEVKAKFFQDLEKYVWEKDAEKMGIYTNPVLVTNEKAIKEIARSFQDFTIQQIYLDVRNVSKESSVMVSVLQFENTIQSNKKIQEIINNQKKQTYLYIDRYLIGIDFRKFGKNQIKLQEKLIEYYQKKVNATLVYKAKPLDEKRFDPVSVETQKVPEKEKYQQLSQEEIDYFFSKTTAESDLGIITKYTYKNNSTIATVFSNGAGHLSFEYETFQEKDNEGKIVYEKEYSEGKGIAISVFQETKYFYDDKDILTDKVNYINKTPVDTVFFIREFKNGKIYKEIEKTRAVKELKRNEDGVVEKQFLYNKNGQLLQKIETTSKEKTVYTYKNEKLVSTLFTYLPDPSITRKTTHFYNSKGLLTKEKTYLGKEKKPDYIHHFEYNSNGNVIKKTSTSLMQKKADIHVFDYYDDGKLKYQISLVPKVHIDIEKKIEPSSPPPPPVKE